MRGGGGTIWRTGSGKGGGASISGSRLPLRPGVHAAGGRTCDRTTRHRADTLRNCIFPRSQCATLFWILPPNQLTLLVIGDPAASFLKPLAALPSDVNVIISKDRDKLRAAAPEADVIFNAEFFDRIAPGRNSPVCKEAPMRWIHAISAGVDKLAAIPEVRDCPVPLTNARGVFREPLGEWIIGMMIFFARTNSGA